MPLHETARNLNRHILRIVRHDAVLIGSAPRGVILNHERFDVDRGSERGNGRPHGYLLCTANITLPASQSSAGRPGSRIGEARRPKVWLMSPGRLTIKLLA